MSSCGFFGGAILVPSVAPYPSLSLLFVLSLSLALPPLLTPISSGTCSLQDDVLESGEPSAGLEAGVCAGMFPEIMVNEVEEHFSGLRSSMMKDMDSLLPNWPNVWSLKRIAVPHIV